MELAFVAAFHILTVGWLPTVDRRDKTSMTLYEITQQFASLNVRPAMVEALVSRAGRRKAA